MATAETIEQLKAVMSSIENKGGVVRPSAFHSDHCGGFERSARGGDTSEDGAVRDCDKAYSKILRLAAVREQCSFDIRERLLREGFSEREIEDALARAQRARVIDDDRFAEAFARSRCFAGKGKHGTIAELSKRGLELPADFEWPECMASDEEEIARAILLLDAKPPRCKNLREGAFRRLVQRGFSTTIAASATRKWCETRV